MRRLQLFTLAGLLPLLLARCNCNATLNEVPAPEIEVKDPLSGKTNNDPKAPNENNAPLIIDFGAAEVTTRSERAIEISNLGNAPLHVTKISYAPRDPNDTVCPSPNGTFGFKNQQEQAAREVAKGEKATVNVTYTSTAGSHCAILLLTNDDSDEGTVKVYLTASGEGAKLCAPGNAMGIIDFGTTHPGVAKQKVQRIESCGSRPVTVTTMAIQDVLTQAFTIVSPASPPSTPLPPCTGSNAAECGFDITLSFTPPSGGVFNGALNVATTSAVGETAYPFQLTGKGASCNLQVIPEMVQFGSVASGMSAVQNVLLRNTGVCHCQVDAITAITPADKGFSFVNLPTTPLVVLGSDGCEGDPTPPTGATTTVTLQVKYEPGTRANSSTDNASFHVQSASAGATPDTTVNLEASGGGTPRCELDVDPVLPAMGTPAFFQLAEGQDAYKRYGLVKFGQTVKNNTKRMPITFTNRGNSDCTISGMAWDGNNTPTHHFGMETASGTAITPGNPNIVIAAGQTMILKATYTPTDANEKWVGATGLDFAGQITACGIGLPPPDCANNGVKLTTNAQNIDTTAIPGGGPGVISFGFNGSSVAPAIEVVPAEVDFGTITLGCGSEEREVKVYNVGNGDLVLAAFNINPMATPVEFRVTANPPTPVTVTPGNSIRVKVRFYPRHAGIHTANLVIEQNQGTDSMGNPQYAEFTVPLQGTGTTDSHVEDNFRQLTDPLVDVLWVVDDSGSMAEEQNALGANFPSFFSGTTINNVDYHIAVTTTLTSSVGCVPDITHPNAPCFAEPDTEAGYYTACNGNDHFISRTTPNPQAQFACNVKVADDANVHPSRAHSDSAEGGLEAAKLFLSQPNINTVNAGFLRDDAKLYVIIISDEEDQSTGPVDLYVDFFQNLKGFRNRNLVSVSAITGGVPTACMEAEPGTRYKDAVDAIANGLFLNICGGDWGNYLTQLAFDSFGLKTQFFLSRNADPAALTVCIADTDPTTNPGAACTPVSPLPEGSTSGYFYDAQSNSVVFQGTSVPARGKFIKVTYDAICLPVQP